MASTAKTLVVLRRCEAVLLHVPEEEFSGLSVVGVLDQVRGLVKEIEDFVLAPRKKRGVVVEEPDETPDLFDSPSVDAAKVEPVVKAVKRGGKK